MQFELGQIVVTSRAGELLRQCGRQPEELLARHRACDWGDVSEEERQLNERGLTESLNLISHYVLPIGQRITVWTKSDRSITMLHVSPPAKSKTARGAKGG